MKNQNVNQLEKGFCPLCGETYYGVHNCRYTLKKGTIGNSTTSPLSSPIPIFSVLIFFSLLLTIVNLIGGLCLLFPLVILLYCSIKNPVKQSKPNQYDFTLHDEKPKQEFDTATDSEKIEYNDEPQYPDPSDADLIEFNL
jgi:hypothetical protein